MVSDVTRARILSEPASAGIIQDSLAALDDRRRWWKRYLIASGLAPRLWSGLTAKLMIEAPTWGCGLLVDLAQAPDDRTFNTLALRAALLSERYAGAEQAEPCRRVAAFLLHQEIMDDHSGRPPVSDLSGLSYRPLGPMLVSIADVSSADALVPALAFKILDGELNAYLRFCTIPRIIRLGYLERLALWTGPTVNRAIPGFGRRTHMQADIHSFFSQALYEAVIDALIAYDAFDDLFGPRESVATPQVDALGKKISWLFQAAAARNDLRTANVCRYLYDMMQRDQAKIIEFYCKCLFVAAVDRGHRGAMGGILIASEIDVGQYRLDTPAFDGFEATTCYPVREDGGTEIVAWKPFGRIDYVRDLRSEFETVTVYRFENCQVYPSGRVIVDDAHILPLDLHGVASAFPQLDINARDRQRHPDVLIQRDGIAALTRITPTQTVDTGILFCGYSYADNFGHFLYQGLPKAFARSRIDGAEDATIIIPGKPYPFQAPVFRHLGISDDEVHHVSEAPVQVGTLFVVQEPPLGVMHLSAWAAIQSMALPIPRDDGPRRIYLSRAKAGRRGVSNEAEIVALLTARGFEIVHPGDLPFEEQMRILNSSEIIVAPHGSALSPLVLCPPRNPRRKIIEFFSKEVADRTAPIFWFFGCDHYTIQSRWQGMSYEDDFPVDAAVLAALLDEVDVPAVIKTGMSRS